MESDNQFASRLIQATKKFPNADVADRVMSRIDQKPYPVPAQRQWSSRSYKAAVITFVLLLSIMGGAYASTVWFGQTVDFHDSQGNVVHSVKIDDLKNYPNVERVPSTSYSDYDSFIRALPATLATLNLQPPQGFAFTEGKVFEVEQNMAKVSVYFQNDQNETYEISVMTDDGSNKNPNFLLSADPNLEVDMFTQDQKEFMFVTVKNNTLLFWSAPDNQGHTLNFTALGPTGASAEELKAAAQLVLN
ncbi:hypothetical protein SD71_19030 [Cohnella kolymensis]|uniref:DUF4367 domain-containing protein n=1 Tax=Cohnella kolymensis TaxID=1590652 RepID=A0ABR5A1P6_9BACL|nr:hypothetical protein [Cohnella kolymensis]KIL34563.1 hypothetical protein SD71_19030 [Cohnella kolymensis]